MANNPLFDLVREWNTQACVCFIRRRVYREFIRYKSVTKMQIKQSHANVPVMLTQTFIKSLP